MADKQGRSELKPRLSQTSQKAGKEPGLESDQSLIPRLATGSCYRTRPSSTRNLDQRIEEAEKQIVEEKLDSADEYRVEFTNLFPCPLIASTVFKSSSCAPCLFHHTCIYRLHLLFPISTSALPSASKDYILALVKPIYF